MLDICCPKLFRNRSRFAIANGVTIHLNHRHDKGRGTGDERLFCFKHLIDCEGALFKVEGILTGLLQHIRAGNAVQNVVAQMARDDRPALRHQ